MDDDDGDYINLLDGSGPEGLYQVSLARAEAAIPLEAANKPGTEGAKRCTCAAAAAATGYSASVGRRSVPVCSTVPAGTSEARLPPIL
jgi:hypothetical protein